MKVTIRTCSQEVGEKMAKTGHWYLSTSCMNSGTANWSNIDSWLRYTLGYFSSKIPISIDAKTSKFQNSYLEGDNYLKIYRIHLYGQMENWYIGILRIQIGLEIDLRDMMYL